MENEEVTWRLIEQTESRRVRRYIIWYRDERDVIVSVEHAIDNEWEGEASIALHGVTVQLSDRRRYIKPERIVFVDTLL